MARGIEGRNIFEDSKDRDLFLIRLAELLEVPGAGRLYAWALMSNHFHLLLRPDKTSLSEIMSHLLTGYAVNFNLRYRRKGHLFQNRFKSIVVEEDSYFLELVRYIHLNPVRAGIVSDLHSLERYRYTGHCVILGRRIYRCQDVATVLSKFALKPRESVTAYRSFIGDGFDQGRREELRGGGLIRSAGGVVNLLKHGVDGRESWDERILGAGDFVEAVLDDMEPAGRQPRPDIQDILEEVASKTDITAEEITGNSRDRRASAARRQFFIRAHKEAGASASTLARLTGRTHAAVLKALKKASRMEISE
jgi:hypothetical protein